MTLLLRWKIRLPSQQWEMCPLPFYWHLTHCPHGDFQHLYWRQGQGTKNVPPPPHTPWEGVQWTHQLSPTHQPAYQQKSGNVKMRILIQFGQYSSICCQQRTRKPETLPAEIFQKDAKRLLNSSKHFFSSKVKSQRNACFLYHQWEDRWEITSSRSSPFLAESTPKPFLKELQCILVISIPWTHHVMRIKP